MPSRRRGSLRGHSSRPCVGSSHSSQPSADSGKVRKGEHQRVNNAGRTIATSWPSRNVARCRRFVAVVTVAMAVGEGLIPSGGALESLDLALEFVLAVNLGLDEALELWRSFDVVSSCSGDEG
jgi:hypothetical protein